MNQYILPKLNSSNPAEWFVYYNFLDPESGKMKRFKGLNGLNMTQTERKRVASDLIAAWT